MVHEPSAVTGRFVRRNIRSWCSVVKRLVRPGMVVKLEVSCQPSMGFLQILVGLQEYFLVLHGAPQPLRKDVVQAASPAVHTNLDTGLLQQTNVRLSQCCQHEAVLQTVTERPADDITAIPIHECHQVHKTLSCPDVGNVRTPDMVLVAGSYPAQQIRVYLVARANTGLTGVWFGVDGLQSEFGHEVPYTLPANANVIRALKLELHTPRAVVRSFGVDFVNSIEL
jgi:hypothetical protein